MALTGVLVVEDDPFSRVLITDALRNADLDVRSAGNAKDALNVLASFTPRVCLLDVDLGPGPTGIDLAHAIRGRIPNVGIVFLTSFQDPRLSKAGDLGLPRGSRYVTKTNFGEVDQLLQQILSAGMKPLVGQKPRHASVSLTMHQIEVMRMVSSGLTNQQIAANLGTSEKAVEHVISRMLVNLGVKRDEGLNPRVQLVQLYAELSGKPAPR